MMRCKINPTITYYCTSMNVELAKSSCGGRAWCGTPSSTRYPVLALSDDEQFSGGRRHARSPKLLDSSAQLADLGSKPEDLQRSGFIHGGPGRP
jgi:hypothetical protein